MDDELALGRLFTVAAKIAKEEGIADEEVHERLSKAVEARAAERAANMGPDIAWFKDPAGNILGLLQTS